VPSGSTYAGTPTDDGTAPTDGNTQVDEFIPGTEPPEIANLTVEVVNQDAVYNSGQYIPTIRVKWDEIREPNINNYKIFVRRISKGPRYNTLVTDTELNDISFSAEFMAPGKSYIIQVVPYNNGYPGITATETVTIPNVDYNRDEIINLTVEWPYDTHPYGYVLGQHGNSDGTLNEDPGGVDHAEWIDFISGTYYKWEDFDGAAWAKMVPYNSTLDQELWSPNPNILSMEFDEEIPMSEGDWAVITGSVTAFEHYWTAGPTSATNKYHSLWDDEGLADSTSSYMRNVPLYYLYYTIYDSSDSVISTIGGAASPANGDPQDGLIIDCRGATNAAYVKVGVNFADPLISSSNQYGKYWVAVQDVALQIHKNIQLSKNWQGVTITSTTAYELPNQASKVARYVTGGNTSDIQPIQEALFATATPTDAETSFFMGRYAGETGTGPLNHKHNVRAVEISTGNPISSVFADITLVGIPTVIQQTVPSGTTNIPRKYVIVK